MAPTANNDNSTPAEAYSQTLGGNPQHAAGTLVFDDHIDVMNPDNSEGYLSQSNTICPADPALASYERHAIDTNDHSSVAARSLENQSFTASSHSMYFPAASNSHSTSDIISSCGIVYGENPVRDISQPFLQPFDTMGYLQPFASATCHPHYDYANNIQSMALAQNIPSYLAPFDAESFNNTPPGLEPPFDMGNVLFPQNTGNCDSNNIDEQWGSPTDFQPHFDSMGANNVLQYPYPTDHGAFSMLPGPCADSASSQILGPLDQHRAPQPMQEYASNETPELLHTVSSRFHPEFADSIILPPTMSQSSYSNDSYRIGIDQANDQLGNLGNPPQIQPPESFDYTDSLMAPGFSYLPLNGRNALYGPPGGIFPNVQQPTEFPDQDGVTSLDSHSHSVYTVRNSTVPNQLIPQYSIGGPMLSEIAGAPSTETALRPLEAITHPLAPPLQIGTESSVNTPREAPSIVYRPEQPSQKSSHQLSKRSHEMQMPVTGPKCLENKPEERVRLKLNRLRDRIGMPKDSIGYFGPCISFSARKRGKGTQKAARERGTCIRCHQYHLSCDSGEGECCNNCQIYWATQPSRSTVWRWTRNNWKSLSNAFVEWLQSIHPRLNHRLLRTSPELFDINSTLSDDTWSMLIGVVDNIYGPYYTTRSLLLKVGTDDGLQLWGYAGQSLRCGKGFELVNPELGQNLTKAQTMFLVHSWAILIATENLEKNHDPIYIFYLAYILIEWEYAIINGSGHFGEWALEAITTRLKIALSRFSSHNGHDLKIPDYICFMLSESAAGRALLPEEYHGLVWIKPLERTAECLPHNTCVDPLHHREGCWCGLIFQSVPLRIIQFYGVLDAADDSGSQWRGFVGTHCSWTRELGEINIHWMGKNGRYKRCIRSAFQNYLCLVLDAFFTHAHKWQRTEVKSFTNQELTVDWKTWRRCMFVIVLYNTAEQLLISFSNHTDEEILHAEPPKDRIFQAATIAFELSLVARKIFILSAQSPGDPEIDIWERYQKELLDLSKTPLDETIC